MPVISADQVCETIYEFLTERDNPALFAGAGVGARAGLPTWSQLMEHLATVADDYEPLTGKLIRKRAKGGHYLAAVAAYKSCPEIPQGEMYEQLAIPFRSPPASNKLQALICLGFRAVFTTNYDRSLHDAFASVTGKSAIPVELGDPTMDRAPYIRDFYIARIHGRAELPETIVLGEDDYQRVKENASYIDCVRHALTRYSCLFLGFSFRDPAIDQVFEVVEDRLSPAFSRLHLAILPADADEKLRARLTRLNIDTAEYDPSNGHSSLWRGIKLASQKYTNSEKIEKPKASFALDAIERFLATSYARKKLESELQPLRDIVLDGIIMDILETSGEGSASFEKVAETLQKHLGISEKKSKQVTQERIEGLSGRGWCRVTGDVIQLTRKEWNELEEDLGILVDGIAGRFEVREGQPVSSKIRVVARQSIEETLVARGWDLGAHFAGAMDGEIPNVLSTVRSAVKKHGPSLSTVDRERLSRACYDLFHRPSEQESIVLGELGRVAFGLNLVINSPCATITHQAVLPERIYLDANVLMPAIVEGHPYRRLYTDAISRLTEAARSIGMPISVLATKGFLNEIISHRNIARREIETMFLERRGALTRHILFQGAENANVFIGAYGSQIEGSQKDLSFEDFLKDVAPYESEAELSWYLKQRGIRTVDTYFKEHEDVFLYQEIKRVLEEGYESDNQFEYYVKADILVDHEARQLTLLRRDLDEGLRSVFVTADMGLRNLIADSKLRRLDSAIISQRGLVQLIDLLVGLHSDPRSLTRLFWSGGVVEDAMLIRDYYTNLALEYRDEAMTASLPQVLEDFVPEVTEAAKQQNIYLRPGGSVESKANQAQFLDRFEDEFYANMGEVVRNRFPDQYVLADEIRLEQLMQHIRETLDLIKQYETKERESSDPAEQARCRRSIAKLRKYLRGYEREAEKIRGE